MIKTKKFEFTEEFVEREIYRNNSLEKVKLYRIKALVEIRDCKVGDLGGYIEEFSKVLDNNDAWVSGNAKVYGDAEVSGNAWVYGDADIVWLSKFGSALRTTTIFRNNNNGLTVTSGCYIGTLEEFSARVEKVHNDNKFGKEYKLIIELAKVHFNIEEVKIEGDENNE